MTISGGYKNIRLKNYDYHDGWFFVTNKTDFGNNYFLDKYKDLVQQVLFELSNDFEGIKIDYFQIMPNHIHVILIFNSAEIPLSEFWRKFKAKTTYLARKNGFIGKSLWQRNYFEHVIRNEIALQRIRRYIQMNPYKEKIPLNEIYER